MRLIVDASVLVAELLRARGRALIAHPQLDLVLAAETYSETEHELRRRAEQLVAHGHLEPAAASALVNDALATVTARVTLVPLGAYGDRVEEAYGRIPRDPHDAPIVALALALNCGIWTDDQDFFGCGLPVWTTETLLRHVKATEGA